MLKLGLYEQLINKKLDNELSEMADIICQTELIDEEEASAILSKYLEEIIESSLEQIIDRGGNLASQIDLANKIVKVIKTETQEDLDGFEVPVKANQLLALNKKRNTIYGINEKLQYIRPQTSIARSSLFTGAINEPQLFTELKKEIVSSNRIDMLVSFIKWSGLRLIIDELKEFTNNGGILRVITTSYMGATDIRAVEELRALPNTSIKISYDTKRTRLHAKTYVFYRETGFSTSYVGSSNLSNAAISSGLEWNVKVTRKDLPDTIEKIKATFESYWNSDDFQEYSKEQTNRLKDALKAEKYFSNDPASYTFDISPYSYQREILDKLEAERTIRGYYRNLVVAATGTGKTVVSAFDYKRYREHKPDGISRLLFVAHREEILKQSLYTFRGILKDLNFGELFVGSYIPTSVDHLFISIQTFNSKAFREKTSEDFYDYIIVDEFHHAAAPTYQKLLNYYQPKVLLGLTATPERMDGKSILEYFDNRIAADIRLPEAIDRKLLCPFQYFGVSDSVDLTTVKWAKGGYDINGLTNVYALSRKVAERRASLIIASIQKYVTDINDVKGLGFCVSIEHAEFMSKFLSAKGVPSISLTSKSKYEDRKSAKQQLVTGAIKFIFVVDLFNEGIDIPEVNTILFLRPTESLTVFLQQLGRGLRISDNKECLTVLDFIGQANNRYNFEEKFIALLSNTEKGLQYELKSGFSSLPKGCYIQLEKKAQDYILENIRASFNTSSGLISRIATFTEDSGLDLNLKNFLNYYHINPELIYMRDNFSRLCVQAGVKEDFHESLETILTKSLARFAYLNSRRLLIFFIEVLTQNRIPQTEEENIMLQMFQFTVWQKSIEQMEFQNSMDGIHLIKENIVLWEELVELLQYKYDHIDFLDEQIEFGFPCPLDLHCTYSRDQILVAMNFFNLSSMRQGVLYLANKKTDLFFVTLNKLKKDHTDTTMYKDYSINDTIFHWQSQSTTSETSTTAKRYIQHRETGNQILLFVREYRKDPITGNAAPYTFLGRLQYISHEGSKPMSILWKLEKPIPGKFLKKTNKLIMG